MSKIIALLFCCASFLFALDLEDLVFLKKDVLEGTFKQTKKITGFHKEIESYGKFSLKGNTLIFEITQPIQNTTKITNEGIYTLQGKDWIKQNNNSNKIFLDIMNLNLDSIKESFDIALKGDKNHWRLKLVPKNIFIKKVIDSIDIDGGEHINGVVIYESNGDTTKNIFKLK